MSSSALIGIIHHEKQEKGSMLCAQHALNCVLQGQYLDATQLSEIAHRLDELERNQMDKDQWDKRGNDASTLNMDDTGFFSLSVLEEALSVWGLTLERWRSSAMKPFQDEPESQSCFVLNLENHWFAFRRFGGREDCWYNLNSFLETPAWVGPRYLGALLNQAETEGYSIFTVRSVQSQSQSQSSTTAQFYQIPSIFLSSEADEVAMTFGSNTNSGSGSAGGMTSSTLGLKSSTSTAGGSGNGSGNRVGNVNVADEEDEELQAALRASLMDSNPDDDDDSDSSSAFKGKEKEKKSNNNNSTRRNRSEESEDGKEEIEENDHHVDLIAPSKNRRKGNHGNGSSSNYQDTTRNSKSRDLTDDDEFSITSCSNSNSYQLPTASGGRRRSSKLRDDDEEKKFAMLDQKSKSSKNRKHSSSINNQNQIASSSKSQTQSRNQNLTSSKGGNSRENAIELDDDDDDDDVDEGNNTIQSRSPFLNPSLKNEDTGVIDVDELNDDDDDDDDEPFSLSNSRNSISTSTSNRNQVIRDDYDEVQDHLRKEELDQVRAHARIGNRFYDDEDEELQAALAASMNDAPPQTQSSMGSISKSNNENGKVETGSGTQKDGSYFAKWADYKSPPPEDVSKIARMREEARLKEKMERERIERIKKGEILEEEENKSKSGGKGNENGDGEDEDEDDDEEEEEEEISPEEIRRRRLARFGA